MFGKRRLKRFLKVVFVLVVVYCLLAFVVPARKVVENNPWINGKTNIVAHRGGAHLDPENTEKLFDKVIIDTTYTDVVEIDILTTKDGVLVINHDSSLNRMALAENEERVRIDDHTFEELQNYNLGRNFVDKEGNKPYENLTIIEAEAMGLTLMSLEEFFIKYNNARDFKLFLEIKEDDLDVVKNVMDKVYEMLNSSTHSWWKERTMMITFVDELIDYTAEKYDDQFVGALGLKVAPSLILNTLRLDSLYKDKSQCLQTGFEVSAGPLKLNCATKNMVERAHRHNQAVAYYTLNNEDDMKKAIDIKADYITTDKPDVLARLLGKL